MPEKWKDVPPGWVRLNGGTVVRASAVVAVEVGTGFSTCVSRVYVQGSSTKLDSSMEVDKLLDAIYTAEWAELELEGVAA